MAKPNPEDVGGGNSIERETTIYNLTAALSGNTEEETKKLQHKTKKFPLKDSLWSAAIVMPLACPFPGLRTSAKHSIRDDWYLNFIKFTFPSLLHVGMLVVIEAFIMEKISSVWEAEFDCTEEPVAFTAYLCIGCLTLYVLASDVCDGIVTFQWVMQIPSTYDSKNNAEADGNLRFRTVEKKRKHDWTKHVAEFRDHDLHRASETIQVVCLPLFGMPWWYRMYCVLLLCCRIGLTMIVLVLGSGYILASREPENQILASLTMVFLVELDDISYALLMPDMVKNKLDDIPAIQVIEEDNSSLVKTIVGNFESYWGYVSTGLLVYTSLFMVQCWCNKEQATAATAFGVPLAMGFFFVVSGVIYLVSNRQPPEEGPAVDEEEKEADKKTVAKANQIVPSAPSALS